jgi:hypothetical protein
VTCHTGGNLKGNASIADRTKHVNGAVDVAFTADAVLSKAQIRDDIAAVSDLNNSWTRQNGYKQNNAHDQANVAGPTYDQATRSCNSVACHNGHTVNWDTSNITCFSCHTGLTQ